MDSRWGLLTFDDEPEEVSAKILPLKPRGVRITFPTGRGLHVRAMRCSYGYTSHGEPCWRGERMLKGRLALVLVRAPTERRLIQAGASSRKKPISDLHLKSATRVYSTPVRTVGERAFLHCTQRQAHIAPIAGNGASGFYVKYRTDRSDIASLISMPPIMQRGQGLAPGIGSLR